MTEGSLAEPLEPMPSVGDHGAGPNWEEAAER